MDIHDYPIRYTLKMMMREDEEEDEKRDFLL